MTDLVERLRNNCNCNFESSPCGAEEECRLTFEAADEIQSLEATISSQGVEIERLKTDAGILLANLDAMIGETGESPDREDMAMVDQIRKSLHTESG